MSYPMESLAIIAPIIFIVMMIAFPIIGAVAGWKRAVYWGGGNLLFYIIGLIIWAIFGKVIGEAIGPKILEAIPALGKADLSKLAQSIVAPAFFIIVMFFGNIVLIINYYTWFRKVAKLKKSNKDEQVETRVVPFKLKFINHTIGAIALPALLLPSSFAFTQAIFYATTSYATRNAKPWVNKLYGSLDECNDIFNWFSYYKTTAKDYDALFAGLSLTSIKVTVILPGETEPTTLPLVDAIGQTLGKGFENIYKAATEGTPTPETVIDQIDVMSVSWNEMIDKASDTMSPLFASDNATALVENMFDLPSDPTTIDDPAEFKKLFDDKTGIYAQTMAQYQQNPSLKTLPVSQAGMDNMTKVVSKYYVLSDELQKDPDIVKTYNDRMNELVSLMFRVE